MLERCGDTTRQTQHARAGPLAPHADAFTALLEREGYAPTTVRGKRQLHDELSRWLGRRKLHAADLNEQRLRLFLSSRVRRHRTRRGDAATCRQLLRFLRGLGCTPTPPEPMDSTALGRIEQDFARFLGTERGLKPVTVTTYLRTVRCFLLQRFGRDELRLDALRLQDVNRFTAVRLNEWSNL
jgi:hypothetical protein